jgi:hypothetical protein
LVPTLTATLRVKGHRPEVGTRDNKGLLYVFAVMNLLSAAVHATTLEYPAGKKQPGQPSKNRRLQEAFSAHRRHVGARCTTCRVEFVSGAPRRMTVAERVFLAARELTGVLFSWQSLGTMTWTSAPSAVWQAVAGPTLAAVPPMKWIPNPVRGFSKMPWRAWVGRQKAGDADPC